MTSYVADAIRTFILRSSAGFDVAKVAVDFQFLIGFAPNLFARRKSSSLEQG